MSAEYKRDVTVTLTLNANEWLAVLWRLNTSFSSQSLSAEGREILADALCKIQPQVLAASRASLQQEGGES